MEDIEVSTVIRPHEDFVKVVESVQGMFPDWEPGQRLATQNSRRIGMR